MKLYSKIKMVYKKKDDNSVSKVKKWPAFAAAFAALGLGYGAGIHNKENISTPNPINKTVDTKMANNNKENSSEIILMQDIHKSFQNNAFYQNPQKYGLEDITSDFQYVYNNALNDNLKDKDVMKLVDSLKKIILQSKKLNAKYLELADRNPSSDEMSLYRENINFYNHLPLDDYISAIQRVLQKNKNYFQFGDMAQYQVLNLHAFVGIKHHK